MSSADIQRLLVSDFIGSYTTSTLTPLSQTRLKEGLSRVFFLGVVQALIVSRIPRRRVGVVLDHTRRYIQLGVMKSEEVQPMHSNVKVVVPGDKFKSGTVRLGLSPA